MERRRLIGVVACAVAGGLAFHVAHAVRVRDAGCRLPEPPADLAPASYLLEEAKAALRAGQWARAQQALAQLKRGHPDFMPTVVGTYEEQAEREAEVSVALEQIRALTVAGRLSDAHEQLSRLRSSARQAAAREQAATALEAAADRLVDRAEVLEDETYDEGSMRRVAEIGRELRSLRPDEARHFSHVAAEALERLGEPSGPALAAYGRGDAGGALALAKACARVDRDCARMAQALAVVVPQLPKLSTLSTPKLEELYAVAKGILDGGETTYEIEETLCQRREAAARRCLAAKNWRCVDQQLAAAAAMGHSFEDETIEANLWAWALDQLWLASRLEDVPPSRNPFLKRVLALKSVESDVREEAEELGLDLTALAPP